MKHLILIAVAIATLAGGCSSCQQPEEAPPAAPEAAGQPAAEAPPAAPEAPAAQAPAGEEEAECFVILDANPDYGAAPLKVEFTADVDCTSGEPTYAWDFGDGSPISTEANPVHTYTKPGDFPATVTVTGTGGGTDSDELDILVEEE
jgi:nucleoid-associated protein YgaU